MFRVPAPGVEDADAGAQPPARATSLPTAATT